jgi:hypothetical protein
LLFAASEFNRNAPAVEPKGKKCHQHDAKYLKKLGIPNMITTDKDFLPTKRYKSPTNSHCAPPAFRRIIPPPFAGITPPDKQPANSRQPCFALYRKQRVESRQGFLPYQKYGNFCRQLFMLY